MKQKMTDGGCLSESRGEDEIKIGMKEETLYTGEENGGTVPPNK